jgi:hypothetical protein
MQDVKEEFNDNKEILKKQNWNSGNEKLNKSNKTLSWKPLQQAGSNRKEY